MSTLAEFMILFGGDNRPPMLEKHLYDSWKSRMELYMQNREHGRMILESVEHGPLIWPMIKENGMTRTKKYEELSATKRIQADYDLKATNIILQGLPSDVYSLVNHHRVSKDLWERVQLLMQGTSLTKQERECKLYDAFDKFAHIKGVSLHQYYLRFTQLINDMNIYKMKLEQFQVNTKFLNSLPSEWSKFVTDVKLVRDLHTTNFDQLQAYIKQHKLHANEVRIMHERNQDPIALGRQSSFATGTSGTRAHISGIGGNNSGQQRVVKCFNCQGEDRGVVEGPVTQTVITHNATYQSDDLNAYDSDCDDFSTAKAVLMANLSSYGSNVLSEVPHSKITHIDMLNQSVQEMQYSEHTHLVNYPENEITSDNNIVNKDNLIANESLSAELERYKEQVKLLEERQNADLSTQEKLIMDDIIQKKNAHVIAKETNVISITDSEETLMHEEERRSKMLLKRSDPKNYLMNKLSDYKLHTLTLTNLLLRLSKLRLLGNFLRRGMEMEAAVQQYHVDKQCFEIQKKQFLIENDRLLDQIISQDIVNIVVNSSMDVNTYVNVIYSVTMNDSVNYVEMCNKCLELEADLIKQHNMNNIFVNQTEPSFDQLFELNNLKAELQAKDTKIEKLKANINHLNKTSTTNSVKKDIEVIETINIELEHRVTKLIAENEHLKQTYKQLYDSIKPLCIRAKEHAESLVNQLNQKSVEITNLNVQLQEKVFVITALKNDRRKFNGKDIVDNAA
ncbi:hypothetical protein Tco_1148310 [Tanacetum coccineum]